jgi:hypothetical protein
MSFLRLFKTLSTSIYLFTGAVDRIEGGMVIEGVHEELELEAGPPFKQELLVTPPTKRSKPNISTIFKEAVDSIKESERKSQERQLLMSRIFFRFLLSP